MSLVHFTQRINLQRYYKKGIFGSRPLQFFESGETPLQFTYFIWTSAIIISILPHLCHFLRLQCIRAHCQAPILPDCIRALSSRLLRQTDPPTDDPPLSRRRASDLPPRRAPSPCRWRPLWGWPARRRGRWRRSATDTTSTTPALAAHVRVALHGVGSLEEERLT